MEMWSGSIPDINKPDILDLCKPLKELLDEFKAYVSSISNSAFLKLKN